MYYLVYYKEGRVMAHLVSRRPASNEGRVLPVHVGFVLDEFAKELVFLQKLRFYPVGIIPQLLPAFPSSVTDVILAIC
jgi:hypothetical protein